MYAVVIYGKEDFRYEKVRKPEPGPEEVLVRIGRAGICAADPKIFHGLGYFSSIVYKNAPIIAGHEFVGEVVELGAGSKELYGLDVGDKAIMENIVPCGKCYYCKVGLYNLCEVHNVPGIKGLDGGWAEYMIYPKGSIIHKVPKDLSWSSAVYIEPLACSVYGVERIGVSRGDVVVLFGCGPIGLGMIVALKLKSPKLIIAIDHHDYRLEAAKAMGANLTINANEEDTVKRVMDETDSLGADVVLEAVGSPTATRQAIGMLRKRGRLLVFGVYTQETPLDWSIISDVKELEIVGGHLGLTSYPTAIKLLEEGVVKIDQIVTHNMKLENWRDAIETAQKRTSRAIKVTMTPG